MSCDTYLSIEKNKKAVFGDLAKLNADFATDSVIAESLDDVLGKPFVVKGGAKGFSFLDPMHGGRYTDNLNIYSMACDYICKIMAGNLKSGSLILNFLYNGKEMNYYRILPGSWGRCDPL